MKKLSDVSIVLTLVLSVSFCTLLIQSKNQEELKRQQAVLERIDKYCNEFSSVATLEESKLTNSILLFFENFPKDDGAEEIEVSFTIDEIEVLTSLKHELHFENNIKLSTNNKVHKIKKPFVVSSDSFVGSDNVIYSAEMLLKFSNNTSCLIEIKTNASSEIVYSSPESFTNIDYTLVPYLYLDEYDTNYAVVESEEKLQKAADQFFNQISKVPEEAYFLSLYDWNYGEKKWERRALYRPKTEVKIGMYGDFKDTDIQKLTVTIEMLKYIAPNLKITFATNEENVTLPIHKVFCSEYVNKLIQCENVGGWYFPDFIYSDLKPSHGSIYVREYDFDTDYSSTIIHELGHALGLGHNNCLESIVTTVANPNDFETFQPMDLATLYAIYSDQFLFKDRKNLTDPITEVLDKEKIDVTKFLDMPIDEVCRGDFSEFDVLDALDVAMGDI